MDSFTDLKKRLERGDATAGEEIFRRYAQQLVRLAAPRLVGGLRQKVDPEDLVQSAFRSFFRAQAVAPFSMDGWDDLWGLLATLTLRKCRYQVRQFLTLKRHVNKEQPLQVNSGSASNWQIVAEEPTPAEATALADLIEQWLHGLQGPTRKIAEFALEGWTPSEIAGKVNLSERTIYRQMRSIQEKLLALDNSLNKD